MITLMTLIVVITAIKWLVIWDKAIKLKVNVLDCLPENEVVSKIFLGLTFFSVFILGMLIIMYLP